MKRKLVTLLALAAAALGGNTKAATTGEMPGVSVQPASYFYTGKPYDADLASYTFAFRSYDPELNRWTSSDPSGFPDGANNFRYVANPLQMLDTFGLQSIDVSRTTTYTTIYDVNAPTSGNTDMYRALINLGLSFAPGVSQAAAVVSVLGATGSNSAPYEPGNPTVNSMFSNPTELETLVGEWSPFSPVGRKVVKTYDPTIQVVVHYVDRFDYENQLYPYAEVHKLVTESMAVE